MPRLRRPWRARPLDLGLVVCLTYFIFGWLSSDVPTALGIELDSVAYYANTIDPFARHLPRHLHLLIGSAAVLNGPLYLVLFWGIWRDAAWLCKVALPFSGLLIGTTALYMAASITSPTPPLNLPLFWVCTGPYVVVPALLIFRCVTTPLAAFESAHRNNGGKSDE